MLCESPQIFPESSSVQALQKSFGWDYKPRSPVCIRMQKRSHMHVKDHVVHVRVGWTMETSKSVTQRALTVSVLGVLKLDTLRKIRRIDLPFWYQARSTDAQHVVSLCQPLNFTTVSYNVQWLDAYVTDADLCGPILVFVPMQAQSCHSSVLLSHLFVTRFQFDTRL